MQNKLRNIAELLFSFLVMIVLGWLIYYNNELQNQIEERDKLISKKDKREDIKSAEKEELFESINNLFAESTIKETGSFDGISFIKKYNEIVKERNNLENENQVLLDSIKQLQWDLNFIKERSGVKINRVYHKNGSTTTSLDRGLKIDSALILLPFYRDRLSINEKGNWVIHTETKNYNDLRDKYLKIQEKHTKLEYENRSNIRSLEFYKNLLLEMSKKGLIKIDSSSDELSFKY